MSDIRAKVAYLHGLAEGLDIEVSSSEGRILTSMIDVLGDLADEIVTVAEAQVELVEYVEDVDYDLGALEESVFGEESDGVTFVPEAGVMQDEDGVTLLDCPECGETLSAGQGELETTFEADCPVCGCEVEAHVPVHRHRAAQERD